MPRRKETEELLLDVASEIFAHNGFHGTTITHIHRRAGVGRGTFYGYFPSKEDLFTAVLDRGLQPIQSIVRMSPEVVAQLAAANIRRRTFDVLGKVVEAAVEQKYATILLLREAPQASPDFARRVEEVLAEGTRFMASVIAILVEQGVLGPVDPHVFSLMIAGTLKEVFRAEVDNPTGLTAKKVLDSLASILLDGTAGAPLRD